MQNIILKSLKKHLHKHWIFYGLTFLLILLLFKNPFSGRNSVSNLDPFPDALMYITASKNLVNEGNLKIIYKSIQLDSTIPPLYSISIAPFYYIFRDPRSFYFANVLFTLISAIFFYKITFKLFKNNLIRTALFLAFVSNFIIFGYSSFAMAENLLICLFIISIYLLTEPITTKRSLFLGLLTTAFFATKYIAWTLSFSLGLTFVVLLFTQKMKKAQMFKLFSLYSSALIVSFFALIFIESMTKEQGLLAQIRAYLPNLAQTLSSISTLGSGNQTESIATYSKSYIQNNLLRYFAGLIGGPAPAAGKDFIITPIIIGMGSLMGIFVNVFFSRLKLLSFYLLMIFLTTFIYVLFLFVTDIRYLFIMIPVQIIVFGISLNTLLEYLRTRRFLLSYSVIIFISLTAITLNIYPAVLTQLKANFFDGDHSRVYQTVMFFNQSFDEPKPGKKPFLISTLPPLMIDYYSNQNYNLLPFSRFQHFMHKPEIWGIQENTDLFKLYKQYIKEGRDIYLSDHDTNSNIYSATYSIYKQTFALITVSTGCQNQCNIFRLGLKE